MLIVFLRSLKMYAVLTKKRAFFITLILIAVIGLATAFVLLAPMFGKNADETFAGVDSANKREPVFTYVIGDPYIVNDDGYKYDKETQTYYYASHIRGWHEAISKSESLGGNVSTIRPDENLVQITLASDWVAQELDDDMVTAFGSGLGFDFARGLLAPGSTNIILDLNGHKIDRNLTKKSTIKDGYVIKLDGTTFELTDNSKEGELGGITGGNCAGNAGCIMVAQNANFILSNGRIFNNNASAGGAVFVDGGKAVINGGIIEGNTANDGGGIYIINNSSVVEMNDCVIDSNIVEGDGGGVYLSDGEFIMNGGIISNNQSGSNTHGGGGFYLYAGTLTINGGEIVLNKAMYGGAIRLAPDATCNIVDCLITGNSAETSGGAIYTTGILNLQGGLFKGNNCSNMDLYGSGAIDFVTSKTISMSGNIQIIDNYKHGTLNEETKLYEGGYENNCFVKDRMEPKINVGELAETAKIHMYLPKSIDKEITIGYGENNIDKDGIIINPTKYFISDSPNKFVLNSKGELQLTNKGLLEWSITYLDNPHKLTEYGYSLEYEVGQVRKVALKQGDNTITDITIKDSEGNVLNVSESSPLKNAGKYCVTAKINGIDNKVIETSFLIIITPYDFTNLEYEYSLSANDWVGDNQNYELKYDGNVKTAPTINVQVSGQPFMSCKVAFFCNGKEVDELKDVGTYKIKILGNGNYTGVIDVVEEFVITQNTDITYRVTWQYYSDNEWLELPNEGSTFTYTSADYINRVRVVLTTDTETRYVYAEGVTDYNLASGEEENDITKIVVLKIDEGNCIIDAGDYNITLQGLTNYRVEESDSNFEINMAQYDLAQIDTNEGEIASADVNVYLDKVLYSGKPKKLELHIQLTINGNKIMLGSSGAEYDYNIKYIDENGDEVDTNAFIIGGDYNVYIYATGNNFIGTLGVIGHVKIEQIENIIDLSGIGNWEYGTYNKRIHGINCQVLYLYDGIMTGPQKEYIYYTVRNEAGNFVDEKLVNFTEVNDDVINAFNSLNAGNYVLYAEVEETISYTKAKATREFKVIQAVNGWITAPSVISWSWNNFDDSFNHLIVSAKYGNNNILKSVMDSNGNVIAGLSDFTDFAGDAVAKLRLLKAGNYKLKLKVQETNNYGGIEETLDFSVAKAENVWVENPHLKRWIHGKFDKKATYVSGRAKYGEMQYFVTDIYGTVLSDLASLTAGEYIITIMVEGTDDYEGLTFTEKFNVFENANMTDKIIAIGVLSFIVLALLTALLVMLIKKKNSNKYVDQY